MMSKKQSLKWRFDVNTFRLIGRELITDRITAIYELVKNCYDANATEVIVGFENVKSSNNPNSKIFIKDNGHGMSFSDVRDKWMVVGTASKRDKIYSDEPFNRRYVGEKGIGRFAVDKLGNHVEIETKQSNSTQKLIIDIDWENYEKLSKNTQLQLFTDVENYYEYQEAPLNDQGTTLTISDIETIWTEMDIKRLERELQTIVSPYYPLQQPFKIIIQSNDFPKFKNKVVVAEKVKYASHEFSISGTEQFQESLIWNKKENIIQIEKLGVQVFGPIQLKIFYFDESAKRRYNKAYKNVDNKVDGIKIYRDSLIATPFAESESRRDKKRDILGIDKRLWSGFLDKVSSREVIGILDISKEKNPKIIDATNRQDFVDNYEYRELKEFVLKQLQVLGDFKKFERERLKDNVDQELKKANLDVKEFVSVIQKLEKSNPGLKDSLEPLKKKAQFIDKSIKKGIQEQKKERDEYVRKENIYLSLMSLQDYAVHISHAVRTSLGKVKRMAEFFKNRFPNPDLEDIFSHYANAIFDEMSNLNRIIDFMLSYAGSNVAMSELNIKVLIENLFFNSYIPVFEAEKIKPIVEIRDSFILNTNQKFFEEIIENLISNSIKALKNVNDKIVKCTGYIENDNFILYYSDNGEGLQEGDEEKIFEMYYTTTADTGGAGIGLYIVKTRIESLKGTIKVVESEFENEGVTFKMTFPFKKD